MLLFGLAGSVWAAPVDVNELEDASAMIRSDEPDFHADLDDIAYCTGNRIAPGARPVLVHWSMFPQQYRYNVVSDVNIFWGATFGSECDVQFRMTPVAKAWDQYTITYDNWVGNADWRDFLPPSQSVGVLAFQRCDVCTCGGVYQGWFSGPGLIYFAGQIPKELVQQWLDNPGSNYGLGLIHQPGKPMNACLGSRQQEWIPQGPGAHILFQAELTPALPGAADPMSGSEDVVPCGIVLSWSGGDYSYERDVYFGTNFNDVNDATTVSDPNNVYKGRQSVLFYPTSGSMTLAYDTTYYWRIDEVNDTSQVPYKGKVWYFTTTTGKASNPDPRDAKGDIELPVTLSWTPGVLAADVNGHDVYLSDDEGSVINATVGSDPNGAYIGRQSDPNYTITDGLLAGVTYYWRVDEVNSVVPCGSGLWKGDVWSFTMLASGEARNPVPADASTVAGPRGVTLGWTAGTWVASTGGHDVYFGTDPCDVIDANKDDTPGVTYVNRDVPNWDPGVLEFDTTYYWRVDEVNDPCVWKGSLWSFIVPAYISVDEFSYVDDNDLHTQWNPDFPYVYPACSAGIGTGAWNTQGSGVMQYTYDNNGNIYGSDKYSELYRDFGTGGVDWTLGSNSEVPAILSVEFQGDITNSADPNYDRMYVGIQDADGSYGQVDQPDPNAQLLPIMKEWVIRLQDFNDQGVNLSKVRYLSLGFGFRCNWNSSPYNGGEGTVDFDYIRLYPRRCILDYKPVGDLTNDCTVDRADLDILANEWLSTDVNLVLSPIQQPANPVLWYKFDDGNDINVADSANGYTGTRSTDTGWETSGGYDGGGYVYLDGIGTRVQIPAAVFSDNVTDAVTISVWINIDRANYPQSQGWAPFMNALGSTPFVIYLPTPSAPTFEPGPAVHWRWTGDPNDDLAECYNVTENDFTSRWHHYAFVKDGAADTIAIYHDGTELCSQSDPNQTTNIDTIDIQQLNLAYITYATWPGAIDDLRIYNYALNSAEIAYIATDGTGSIQLPLATPADMYPSTPNIVNFQDYALLANNWMQQQLWP